MSKALIAYFSRGGDNLVNGGIKKLSAGNTEVAAHTLFVVPELNLVTAITAIHRDNTYLPRTYFSDYILEACVGT